MSSYFAKKFSPATPVYVVGRSYMSEPERKPQVTLFDQWLDPSHPHIMGPPRHGSLSQRLVDHDAIAHTTLHGVCMGSDLTTRAYRLVVR